MVSRTSANPAVRRLVDGAVLAAVLLGDGLVLIGYPTRIRGHALSAPGSSPEAAAPVPLSPPLLPEGPPAVPGAESPAPEVTPPGAAARPEPPSATTRERWPGSLPDPEAVARDQRGRSPFTQRCASGEIAARWCSGFPGEH